MTQNRFVWFLTLAFAGLSIWGLWPNAFKGEFGAPQMNLGLDLQGGTYLKLEVETDRIPKDAAGKPMVAADEAVARAVEVIRNRVDNLGLKEPLIQREGERYIVVQLPGDKDPERTQDLIGQTAQLQFKLESQRVALSEMLDANGNTKAKTPEGVELAQLRGENRRVVLEARVLMTGEAIKDAHVEFNQSAFGEPIIAFELSPEGSDRFAKVTEENVGRNLAIQLDGVVRSAPRIKSRIGGGRGIIEGGFTLEEAKDLALVLRSGALPAPLKIINKNVVGPSLGADTVKKGAYAAMIGTLLVLIYMAVYYRVSGLIANMALLFNLLLLMGFMAWSGSTLTLPGIAGIVLTMGMSVDANVLIFERIREELRAGKTIRASVDAGYKNALFAIVDSAVTTLIAAAVLFQFGTGPIKGFAVTFAFGLISSFFTAVYVTKAVFDARKTYSTLSI